MTIRQKATIACILVAAFGTAIYEGNKAATIHDQWAEISGQAEKLTKENDLLKKEANQLRLKISKLQADFDAHRSGAVPPTSERPGTQVDARNRLSEANRKSEDSALEMRIRLFREASTERHVEAELLRLRSILSLREDQIPKVRQLLEVKYGGSRSGEGPGFKMTDVLSPDQQAILAQATQTQNSGRTRVNAWTSAAEAVSELDGTYGLSPQAQDQAFELLYKVEWSIGDLNDREITAEEKERRLEKYTQMKLEAYKQFLPAEAYAIQEKFERRQKDFSLQVIRRGTETSGKANLPSQ
jgi:hypothetical protein